MPHRFWIWTLALFLLSASRPADAQEAPARPDAPYTIQQRVRAVVLDVAVTDRAGKPVSGLTKQDFVVEEDGRPQNIASFEAADAHLLRQPWGGGPAPADLVLNGEKLLGSAGEAPLTILLVDEISTEPEDLYYARQQLKTYLKALPATLPGPTMLLVLTNSRLKVLSDYTLDRTRLISALDHDKAEVSWYVLRDRYPGFKATGTATSVARLEIYLGTLSQIAAANSAYPGRKNIVWIGPGLPALNSIAVNHTDKMQIGNVIRKTATLLLKSRATLYTVDPQGVLVGTTQTVDPHAGREHGLSIVTDTDDPAESSLTFEQLAPETGGKIFGGRNDVGAEINDSVKDGKDYYSLTYYPNNEDFNGQYRRIHVRVKRPQLKTRTREGYYAVIDPMPTEDELNLTLALALSSSLPYQGISFTTELAPVAAPAALHLRASGKDLYWTVTADGQRQARVSIVAGMIAADGKLLGYKRTEMVVHGGTPGAAAAEPKAAEFDFPAAIPANTALIRVVLCDDATGHLGSQDVRLDASRAALRR